MRINMYKILIADDELFECRGLDWIIRHSFPEIEILPYVQNGLDLIRSVEDYRPDLLLLDINMPGLNGLDALEILQMKNLTVRVILVTAYRDFSYAQKAIQLGVCDYILKPAQKDCVSEVVRKQLEKLNTERYHIEERKKHVQIEQQYESLLMEQLIKKLISDEKSEKDPEQIEHALQQLHITNTGFFCVIIEEGHSRLSQEETAPIKEALQDICQIVCHVCNSHLYLLLFPDERIQEDWYCEWVTDALESVLECLGKEKKLKFRAGISSWYYDSSRLRIAFRECSLALYGMQGSQSVAFFEKEGLSSENERYFVFQKTYFKKLAQQRTTESFQMLDQFFLSFSESTDIPLSSLYCIDLLYGVWEIVSGRTLSDDLTGHWKSWKKVLHCSDQKQLHASLICEIQSMIEAPFQKKNYQSYVQESLHYMRAMYADSLSLDSVAQKIGITPFYLSRLFKQEVSQTFLECLTDIRIIRAVEMVYQGEYSVKEISWSVGYPNSNYFYKIFKKVMGVTLGELKAFVSDKKRYQMAEI